jgi:hypothetical protein
MSRGPGRERWRRSDRLLAFLDELLSYLESVRDVRSENDRLARRAPEIERLTQEKTRVLRNAVSAERQKH